MNGILDLPIPIRLTCPECGALHVDEGDFATRPHHTHACQECGLSWRPAIVDTIGVRFLPGFRINDEWAECAAAAAQKTCGRTVPGGLYAPCSLPTHIKGPCAHHLIGCPRLTSGRPCTCEASS